MGVYENLLSYDEIQNQGIDQIKRKVFESSRDHQVQLYIRDPSFRTNQNLENFSTYQKHLLASVNQSESKENLTNENEDINVYINKNRLHNIPDYKFLFYGRTILRKVLF